MKLREGNLFTLVCDSVHREGEGLCLGGGKVSVRGHLSPLSLCLGTSLPRGLCPGGSLFRECLSSGVSVQALCPGDLFPGGLYPGASLSRGSLSSGVSIHRVLCPGISVQWGLYPGGSLSRGVSVQGSLSSGVSIQWGLCPGHLCPGGLCPGEFLSRRVLSLSWRPPVTVVERAVRILRNAFCSQEVRTLFRRCNLFNEVKFTRQIRWCAGRLLLRLCL